VPARSGSNRGGGSDPVGLTCIGVRAPDARGLGAIRERSRGDRSGCARGAPTWAHSSPWPVHVITLFADGASTQVYSSPWLVHVGTPASPSCVHVGAPFTAARSHGHQVSADGHDLGARVAGDSRLLRVRPNNRPSSRSSSLRASWLSIGQAQRNPRPQAEAASREPQAASWEPAAVAPANAESYGQPASGPGVWSRTPTRVRLR
jgi:hypothetical protein